MKLFQKILKNSLPPKATATLAGTLGLKGLDTNLAIEYSTEKLHMDCKNNLINDDQSSLVLFFSDGKKHIIVEGIAAYLNTARQITFCNSNLTFIGCRA